MNRRPALAGLWALLAYAALAFAAFGLRLVLTPGSQLVGSGDDPQIFVWSLAWWPHAILHGQNPFVTDAVWAPSGLNLAWATTVPALAVGLAPLTLALSAFSAYDTAAVMAPALAAWTCFLLCRRLTGSWWASFAGGLLFGCSSYLVGHMHAGHLNLVSVCLVPLLALVVLDFAAGRIGSRGLALRLGPLLAVQLLVSSEVAASATLALVIALGLGAVLVPGARPWMLKLLPPLAAAYAFAALLAAPFLWYALSDFPGGSIFPPSAYASDVLSFVVPTNLQAVGQGWTGWTHFRGSTEEHGAFLGWPLLAIIVLFALERRQTPGGRFLLAALVVAALLSLGPRLHVDGHGVLPLPWRLVSGLPVFDKLLPARFTLYLALAAAVVAAIWAATSRRPLLLRAGLPLLAVLALVPWPGASFATTYAVPEFFSSPGFRSCVPENAIVLPLPIADRGQADLWQVANGFHFRLAGGRILGYVPPAFDHPKPIQQLASGLDYPERERNVRAFVRREGVSYVILDPRFDYKWQETLDRVAHGADLAGVRVYALRPGITCG